VKLSKELKEKLLGYYYYYQSFRSGRVMDGVRDRVKVRDN